jgi:hypothetical protein
VRDDHAADPRYKERDGHGVTLPKSCGDEVVVEPVKPTV